MLALAALAGAGAVNVTLTLSEAHTPLGDTLLDNVVACMNDVLAFNNFTCDCTAFSGVTVVRGNDPATVTVASLSAMNAYFSCVNFYDFYFNASSYGYLPAVSGNAYPMCETLAYTDVVIDSMTPSLDVLLESAEGAGAPTTVQ